jgi:ATP-dependent DNA helicase RecQ
MMNWITNKSVLLLDEVQDINAEEWALIQKIVELASNMRVIAVGDDDQNIYSFRGSSNKYMGEYKRLYNAKEYSLIRNYRSRKGIIDFNNHLLLRLSNRLKSQPLIPAHTTKRANIKVVNYANKHLIAPLAKALVASELEGRFAVLVRTNEEVLLVSSILKQLGRKTRLLSGFEGFSIANLAEVRTFSNSLKNKVHGSGLILETTWHECFHDFQGAFRNTPHFQVCIYQSYSNGRCYSC